MRGTAAAQREAFETCGSSLLARRREASTTHWIHNRRRCASNRSHRDRATTKVQRLCVQTRTNFHDVARIARVDRTLDRRILARYMQRHWTAAVTRATESVPTAIRIRPINVYTVAAEECAEHIESTRLHPHTTDSRRRVVAHLTVLQRSRAAGLVPSAAGCARVVEFNRAGRKRQRARRPHAAAVAAGCVLSDRAAGYLTSHGVQSAARCCACVARHTAASNRDRRIRNPAAATVRRVVVCDRAVTNGQCSAVDAAAVLRCVAAHFAACDCHRRRAHVHATATAVAIRQHGVARHYATL